MKKFNQNIWNSIFISGITIGSFLSIFLFIGIMYLIYLFFGRIGMGIALILIIFLMIALFIYSLIKQDIFNLPKTFKKIISKIKIKEINLNGY